MEIKVQLLLLLLVGYGYSYLVGIDYNTYNANQLNDAIKYFGHTDFTWAVPTFTPGVTEQLWKQVLSATNNQIVYSEDAPMQFRNCVLVKNLAGRLTAAFGYHETGGTPATQLSAAQIQLYADKCGSQVIILTRAYWPNSDWRTKTDQVLHHPKLYGVAMEFNPNDFGKRNEVDYINNVLAAGKVAMFLLPFINKAGYPTEKQITDFIQYLKSHNVNMSSNRILFVLARYDQPLLPITGSTNSILSALHAAQRLKSQ